MRKLHINHIKKIQIFTLLITVINIQLSAAPPVNFNTLWTRYFSTEAEMHMDDLVAVGSGIIATGSSLVINLNDETINNCITNPSPVLTNRLYSWMNSRPNGEIWLSSKSTGTIYRYRLTDFMFIDSMNSYPVPLIIKTVELRNGNVLAGTSYNGIYIYDGATWKPLEGSPKGIYVYPELEDKHGNLWVASSQNGAFCYDTLRKTWTNYTSENSGLTAKNITAIIDDKYGNIIFTSADTTGGIYILQGTNWKKYDKSNAAIQTNIVFCMSRDSTGNIWFGSERGVFRWDGGNQWDSLTSGTDIYQPFGYIRDIVVDSKNRVWVASFHLGFYLFNNSETACPPKLNFTYPTSTTIAKRPYMDIRWNYEGPVSAIKLEYRIGNNDWSSITQKSDNTRKYRWPINNTFTIASDYQLRISSVDNPAVFDTSARFTIADSGVNIPPELSSLPDTFEVKINQRTTFTVHANDIDKDTLRFSYSGLPSWVTVKDSVLTFEPQTGSQSFTLKVTVTDGKGGTAQDSMVVAVVVLTGTTHLIKSFDKRYLLRNKSGILVLNSTNAMSFIHASLYDLCGKKVGDFIRSNNQLVFDSRHIQTTGKVYLLVLGVLSENSKSRIVEKLIIQ